MLPNDRARFVEEACRTLRLMQRITGQGARYRTLLTDYRTVADALGCRAELEERVRREVLYSDALAAG